MSNYIKTTNFASKDSLPSGNPAKIVKGTEINTEFDNIAVASATKLNSSTVSTFGATLIDDANASAARTTLGLGTAATTASTDYATAAQGTTADAALPKIGGAMTGAITTNSTFDGVEVAVRDGVLTSTTTTANAALPKAGGAMTGAITTNSTFDGRDVATDGTKLDGIEASADVTDTANVTAAGALMDSEVTNLVQVKAFDSSDYATAAQGTLAANALPKAGGTMSGAIAMGTSKITGAGDPTAAQDVATKAYVDANAGGGSGTITGVTAGDGLSGGGTTGAVTVDVDSTVVRTTGAQSIGGQKDFNNIVLITGSETSGVPTLRLTAGTVNDSAVIQFGDSADVDTGKIEYLNAGNHMAFTTNASERARLTAGGDFLVGKTTTNITLAGVELHNGGGLYNSFQSNGYDRGLAQYNFYSTGSYTFLSGNGTASMLQTTNTSGLTGQSLYISGGGSGTYATFTNQKRLGIGVTAPTESLHVLGNIVATGNITAYFSDERLKDFKGTIPNALDKVSQLNGYYYTPNETAQALGVDNNGVEVGVSAQEVEAVLPEIVTKSVVGQDYKTVMYEKLTPLLIEAVKELTQKVAELELRLDKVEK